MGLPASVHSASLTEMLNRLIIILDLLSLFWVGLCVIEIPFPGVLKMILVVLVPYGLLRWVLVGAPIPFTDKAD